MLGVEVFDELPKDEGIEIHLLINANGELDGIDVN